MDVKIGDIVGEILAGNIRLDRTSSYDDFVEWLDRLDQDLADDIYTPDDYPNFELYFNTPTRYWPFVEHCLKG